MHWVTGSQEYTEGSEVKDKKLEAGQTERFLLGGYMDLKQVHSLLMLRLCFRTSRSLIPMMC